MDIQQIISIDRSLLWSQPGSHSLFWDGFMWMAASVLTWMPVGIILLYVVIKNSKLYEWVLMLLLSAVMIVVADFSARLIDAFLCPYMIENDGYMALYGLEKDAVSGGVYLSLGELSLTSYCALAVFFALMMRRLSLTCMLMGWALLLSYTQIYWNLRSLFSSFWSFFVGSVSGIFFYLLWRFVQQRYFHEPYCISNQYTATGYLISDIQLVNIVMLLTYFCLIVMSMILVYQLYL